MTTRTQVVIAFALCCVAAAAFYLAGWGLWVGVVCFGVGVFAVGTSLYWGEAVSPSVTHGRPHRVAPTQHLQIMTLVFGVLCLAWLTYPVGAPVYVQLGLLVMGVALVALGLGGRPRFRLERGEVLVVVGLTALALLLRTVALESALRAFVDEVNFSNATRYLRGRDDLRLLEPMNIYIAFPHLYAYLQTLSVDAFGRNLVALRLPSTVFGALTVPALYWLARELFNRHGAVVAALLLATFPPHLHFSRLALNNVAEPLFGVLALAALARGVRTGERWTFALGGVMLGMTQYFYEGGRLVFPGLVAAWVIHLWLTGRGLPRRALLTVAVGFVIVAAPVYVTLWSLDFSPAVRFEQTRQGVDSGYLRNHLALSLQTFVSRADVGWTIKYYDDNAPLVPVWLVPAFLLGVAVMLRRWRDPAAMLVLLWLALTVAGNSLLEHSAVSARYVVAFPALVLAVVVGLKVLAKTINVRRGVTVSVVALLVIVGAGYFFVPYMSHFRDQSYGRFDAQDAIFRAATLPPDTRVHLVAQRTDEEYLRYGLQFLADGLWFNVVDPAAIESYLDTLSAEHDHAFFLTPFEGDALLHIQARFTVSDPTYSPYRLPVERQYVLFYAPAARQE